ncbi:formylglycine-generating enzyme family protein [Pseudanabaena sp. PCC 6802]|uniref:formylglycine-generating enzyme family protein n=1 Tax=Pseudanabaena sp. PCC 6802 TaxID=118173 RepID=UPI0003484DEF|nr:formylglycine-generating enzyme family protein [Pseudanabaena sp. PCC 6802]
MTTNKVLSIYCEIAPRVAYSFREALAGLVDAIPLEMVKIPGGTFVMGAPPTEDRSSNSEHPQHEVTVRSFFMGKYPVTQAQYQAVMGKNPSHFKENGANCPVENVSWNAAKEFCAKLSELTGKNYRLPSEAEWEYACRAGTTTPFYFGETITPELVNYGGNYPYGEAPKGESRQQTTAVGIFSPNAFGLYDMHGNVWEWCEDNWHENYQGAPTDGRAWVDRKKSTNHVSRGGSWSNNAYFCRSAYRINSYADFDLKYYVGFRVVVSSR